MFSILSLSVSTTIASRPTQHNPLPHSAPNSKKNNQSIRLLTLIFFFCVSLSTFYSFVDVPIRLRTQRPLRQQHLSMRSGMDWNAMSIGVDVLRSALQSTRTVRQRNLHLLTRLERSSLHSRYVLFYLPAIPVIWTVQFAHGCAM